MSYPIQLSENFTLSRMLHSDTAARHSKELLNIQQNPPQNIYNNLFFLAQNCLQPLRDLLKVSLWITSGWRCPELNTLIGGSKTSFHMKGLAADFIAPEMDNFTLVKRIRLEVKNGNLKQYDQLILEYYPGGWVHIAHRPDINRGLDYTASAGKTGTKYVKGFQITA